jgi:hypothetical protein
VVPEKELDALREHSRECIESKQQWTQRIQTAELNEAAQRSIH